MAVQEKSQAAGVYLDYLSIHRIREALQIISQFTNEPSAEYGGMKIRHEVRFINQLLTEAVSKKAGRPCVS